MKKKFLLALTIMMIAVCCFSLIGCNDKGVKIGVQGGTTGELYIKGSADFAFDGYPNLQAAAYDNAGLAIKAMKNGQVKYVVVDDMPARNMVANIDGIKLVDIKLSDEQYAFAVDKENATLLANINTFMAKIKANGTLDSIINKYYTASETITGLDISTTPDATREQLYVVTNAAFPPFEYKIGNKFAGIDIELANLIALELNMELVIKDTNFDSVVTSIGKEGVDIGMAGLTVTPEREEVVNFTTTYFNASQKIICLKDDTTFDGLTTMEQVEAILKGLK